MKNLKKIKSGNFDKLILSSSEEVVELYLDTVIDSVTYIKILQEISVKQLNTESVEYVLNKNNIQVAYKTFSKIGIKSIIFAYKYQDYLGELKIQHELIESQFKYTPVVQSGKPALALFIKFIHNNEIYYINKAVILDSEDELNLLKETIAEEQIIVEKIKNNFELNLLYKNYIIKDFLR